MTRKMRAKQASTNTPPATDRPWWKGTWLKLSAGIAALALLLTNINSLLSNARQLPGELRETVDQFSSWYHKDTEWNGRWTNRPEGYADETSMNLSKDDIEIRLHVENGEIDGTIATKRICNRVPFNDFLLLRGDITGANSARVVAWDIFEGRAADVATLKLVRDGVAMKVTFEGGADQLFPSESKIALDPNLDRRMALEPPGPSEKFCTGNAPRTFNAAPKAFEGSRYTASKAVK